MSLSSNFKVSGYYYQEEEESFRKYLHIRKKGHLMTEPDLLVVMMNPGSSEPINGKENERCESPAKPDATQYRVMRVMDSFDYKFARILNLSNYRNKSSGRFYKAIEMLENKGIVHSIFDPTRSDELKLLLPKGCTVVLAWGVSNNLKNLAEQALKSLAKKKIYGANSKCLEWQYYHPMARKVHCDWLGQITKQLNNSH